MDESALAEVSPDDLESLVERSRKIACASNVEAFDLVFSLFAKLKDENEELDAHTIARFGRDAIAHLKKIAFRKYAAEYRSRSAALREAFDYPAAARFRKLLDALDVRAALRGV